MTWQFIIWNDELGENVDKIAQHGLAIDDVEYVLHHPERKAISRSSKRPLIYGTTPGGDYIVVIYEEIDDETIYPITAYIPDKD